MLESEIKKLQKLVSKLIDSTSKEIESLENLSGLDLIKNEKILTDILNKLVKITLDINKSIQGDEDNIIGNEEDKKIIDRFYKNYHLNKHNEKR
jgi:hypothetical protein